MDAPDCPEPAEFAHIVSAVRERWPADVRLLGIILFGSRAKFRQQRPNADWDVGILYSGEDPRFEGPADWDVFLWDLERWEAGFALQVEIARSGIILFDPEDIIHQRFNMIHERILPFWGGYLKRF